MHSREATKTILERDYIIKRLHEAHKGLAKMLSTTKDNVLWPAMRQDLTNITTQCKTCQTFVKSQWKPPHTVRELPTRPWQYVATDLFQLDGKIYLLTVDIFSKYPIRSILHVRYPRTAIL